MICDKIIYAGETILTIYHRGFVREKGAKRLCETLKVGRFNLCFKETVVDEKNINLPNEYTIKFEGLIDAKSNSNPYKEAACAYMEHYIVLDKPKRLFGFENGKFNLSTLPEHLQQINSFVEQYTGLKIAENPMFYGDTFVFTCHERNYRANKDAGIIVSSIKPNTTILVNFKKNGAVVSAKKIHIDEDAQEVYVDSGIDWTYLDIEIFEDDKLVYCDKDVSYIRHIFLNTAIGGTANHIKLKTLGGAFRLQDKSSEITSHIGDPIDEIEELLNDSNRNILRLLKESQDDNRTTFISPNEYEKAFKIIAEVMQSAKSELWVFDPYFSNIDGWNTELDFLRLLAHCDAKSKNIVFFAGNVAKAYDAAQVKTFVTQDIEIQKVLQGKNELGLNLYQSKAYIHDRFVITKDDNGSFSGIVIGASLNGIGRNYFCIVALKPKSAKTILEDLQACLDDNNIVAHERM